MIKDNYEISDELAALQDVETDLLRVLIDVCREHELGVWLGGGTLLGAIRHKGFIPWDDDIDVYMMREDYDKLVALAPTVFDPPYFFQCAYTDIGYYRGHAQLRNSETTAIRPSDSYQKFNQGIFIDIFPLDGCPKSEAERIDTHRKTRRIMRFLKAANCDLLASGRIGLVFRKWKARRAVRTLGWNRIFGHMEDILRQYPVSDSEFVAERSFTGDKYMYHKYIFDKTLWVPFENILAPIPEGWEEILLAQYGKNYMTPIKAPTVHGALIIDTHRSYREVAPEVARTYRRTALKRLWNKLRKK